MSDKDKRAAIILAAVVIAVIIYLLFNRRAGSVIGQESPLEFGDVNMPGFNLGGGTGNYPPIVIPLGDRDLHMIGACCADCSGAAPARYVPARGSTYVYNAAAQGPNIFNYFTPAPVRPKPTSGAGFTRI